MGRRLPISIYSIKKDVSKMQHSIANADYTVHHFPFFPMVFCVTAITYTVCYIALDPDQIAEAQCEIDMYGYKVFLEHLTDPSYHFTHHDDEEEEDEWEYFDEDIHDENDDHKWEYYEEK